MSTFLQVTRHNWRWALSIILSISISAAIVMSFGITKAQPVLAASTSSRGPSAAIDDFNNQYVFWRGTDDNLWEAFYSSYTGKWNGPLKIGMGPLGSEPSVTVSNQHFAGSSGKLFSGQYVYWQGENGHLWMAYWSGSWHGPIQISGVGTICSQPSAAFVDAVNGPKIYVFWKGIPTSGACGSDRSSNSLWYTFSTSFPPYSNSNYSGPNYDTHAGIVGSSPSITAVPTTGQECLSTTCQDGLAISWQGTNGYLWEEFFNVYTGDVTGPASDAKAFRLGSPPSIAAPLPSAGITDGWYAFWQGSNSNHSLWFADQNVVPLDFNVSPQHLSNSGTLGSAPTVDIGTVHTEVINTYVFWKGTDAKLWEAYNNGSTNQWSIIGLGMGPLG